MMNYIKPIISLVTLFVFLIQAEGQKTLSLQESRDLAIEYNKTLKVSALKKVEAEAQKKEAFTNYLPNLAASGSAMYYPGMEDNTIPGMTFPSASDPNVPSDALFPGMVLETEDLSILSGGVNLTQPIYAGGQVRLANKMATTGVEISEQAFQLQKAEVILNTDEAYWNLVAMRENVTLSEKYVLMLDSLAATLNDSYELGLVPKSEQLKVIVQKNDAELNLLRARNGYRIMQMNLCRIIGVSLDTQIQITEGVKENIALPDLSNGISTAMAERQELKILDGQIELSNYQKKLVNADFLPQLGAQVGYQHYKVGDLLDQGNFAVGASLSIPIFHWNEKKHKKTVAKSRVERARLNYSDTQDMLQLEVQQVMIKLQEGYEYVLLSQKNKQEAQESLEETEVSFEVGLNTTTDLLNAQAAWQNALAQEISALTEFEILKTRYQKAIGQL
ncbi:TolC family protein [Labilibacter sediminis]|nr:TolC family protein [Labilibacter sediminis]